LYKQADMGFAAEAGLFFWGGKGAFRPKKGCNALSAGYGFPRKKGGFFSGGGKGAFRPNKGCNASSIHGLQISKKKNPPQAQSKYSHSEYFDPPTYIGI
jgi:hypothetical protein